MARLRAYESHNLAASALVSLYIWLLFAAFCQANRQTWPFADGAELLPRPFNQCTRGVKLLPCP